MENKKKNFNAFEGARRLAIFVGIMFAVGCAVTAYNAPSIAYLHYSIGSPLAAPILVDDCEATDKTEYIGTERLKNASITLCFPLSISSNGKMLIPYKMTEDGKSWWMDDRYSINVSNYASAYAMSFRAPLGAKRSITLKLSKQRHDYWMAIGKILVFGLAGWWAFVFVMGWIVRGFMSIPNGQDKRNHD